MARYFHELQFSLLQFLKASTTVKKELFLLKHYIDLLYSKQTRFDCTSYLLISLLLKSCTWGKNNSIFWILPLILLCPTPLVKDKQSYVLVSLKYKKVSTKTVMSMCIASAVNLGYSWFEAVIISQKKWMFKCSFELIVKKNGSGKSRITSQQSFLFCLGFFYCSCYALVWNSSELFSFKLKCKWTATSDQMTAVWIPACGRFSQPGKDNLQSCSQKLIQGDRSPCGSSSDHADK